MDNSLQARKMLKILLVEDDPVNIAIILDCLADHYELFIAKSKLKTFKILETERVDIALLDVNLPDGSGFDICHQLVENKEVYGEISIIFMTAMNSAEDEARGINLGARDYIHKPINCTVLHARLNLQAQLIRQTQLLSNLARIDGLTEINNRRAFDDRLRTEWNRAQREKQNISLILLDIDYFKAFNDNYGHPAGDQCLQKIARCLSSVFKRGSDFVARYGGEEFAVIVANCDHDIVVMLAKRALESLEKLAIPHSESKVRPHISFSAGVCSTTPENNLYETFIGAADNLLYQAKEEGRARICDEYIKHEN